LENCTLADNRVVGGRGGNPGSDQFDNDAPPGTGGNGLGGALQGPFVLESCTIAGNAVTGGLGGQGYSLTGAPGAAGGGGVNAPGAQSIHNSIVAGNTGSASSPDVSGTVTSQGWNLIGITNGSSGWTASDLKGSAAAPLDPKLGPVQDNGGLTPTIALLSGSPAIDQGKSSGLTTDQRGRPRSFDWPSVVNAAGGDGSDIGAFERGPPALSITRSGNQVLLSWPASELVFRLQGADTLPAGNTWASVPGNPVLSGGIYQITRNISGASKFYRLINP